MHRLTLLLALAGLVCLNSTNTANARHHHRHCCCPSVCCPNTVASPCVSAPAVATETAPAPSPPAPLTTAPSEPAPTAAAPSATAPAPTRGSWQYYTDTLEFYGGAWHYAGRILHPDYSHVLNQATTWKSGNPRYRDFRPNPPQRIWVP